MLKVMIDPGHFKGNVNKGQTGYYEHEGVWKISNYLKDILETYKVQVDFTKPYEGDMDFYARGQKAQGYDVFISQHTNANNDPLIRGVEVFYDFSKPHNEKYANELSLAVSKLMDNPNRGAKTKTYWHNNQEYNYYGVIRGASATDCPHIFLIESGFHSNLQDEAFLKNDDNLRKIAEAQADVLLKMLGVDKMSYNKVLDTLSNKVKLDTPTIRYLEDYTYGEDLVYKISQAVNGEIVTGKPSDIIRMKPTYRKYNNNIHEIKGEVADLGAKIVDKRIWNITEYTNIVNGTFFWIDDNGKTYSTSPLIINGVVHQRYCNHKLPQSVFVIYKNNTVALQRVTDVYQIRNFNNVKHAFGGVGLVNTLDNGFVYSPSSEGFSGKFADALQKRNKTVLGYNARQDKIYLLVVRSIHHDDLIRLITDNSGGEAYDIAISLDGGGSSFMDANWKYVFHGNNLRRIHNILGFGL